MTEFKEFHQIIAREILQKQGAPVLISRPRAIGVMANINEELVTPEKLRYFKMPPPSAYPLDLNLGYDDYTFRSENYFTLNLRKLETFLMENDGRSLLHKGKGTKKRICTFRSVLKSVMRTPYLTAPSKDNDWSIKATKFDDVIYMILVKKRRGKPTPNETYHFKFMQYCFADSPYEDPIVDKPVNENDHTFGVFRRSVQNFEIYYAAEIAGVESNQEIRNFREENVLNKCNFVITKLLREPRSSEDPYGWKKNVKLLDWWIQSYFVGARKIYFGFKTKEGFVNRHVQQVMVENLPKDKKWKPKVCKGFLHDFLLKLDSKMANVDCPYTTYEFRFDSVMKIIKYRVFEGKTDESFLTDKFIQYMRKI